MTSDLKAMYARRFHGGEERRIAVWKPLSRYFQRWIRDTDTVLDLGAGYCEFINQIRAKSKFALDQNADVRGKAAPDVTVVLQDVAEPWAIASDSVDVVFSSNFFEHVSSKTALLHCLRESHRLLRASGTFIAMGPNIRFCPDVYWDFYDHIIPLSDRSLVEAMELSGFRVEHVVPRFLPYTMKSGLPTSPKLVSMYLSLPWLWPLFGKQFLVFARKT